jgi:hypothetical protein
VGEVVPFSNKTQEIKSLNKHTTQHAKQNKESGGMIEGKRRRREKAPKKTHREEGPLRSDHEDLWVEIESPCVNLLLYN